MPIRLHVIYAGRGDAMLIEDNNRLILLDGAPRGYAAGESSGAPYYRYVLSALREVSASMGRATPSSSAGIPRSPTRSSTWRAGRTSSRASTPAPASGPQTRR